MRLLRNDRDGAAADLHASLPIYFDLGEWDLVALHLESFAALALAAGRRPRAATLIAAAGALRRRTGIVRPATQQAVLAPYREALAELESAFGTIPPSPEQAVAIALADR
jgi:hypothetical protein